MANNYGPSPIRMKPGALYKLRSEPGVIAELERRGGAILRRCGGERAGYMMASRQGKKKPQGRWQVTVFTATAEAMVDNQRHNTLVRNFGAARG